YLADASGQGKTFLGSATYTAADAGTTVTVTFSLDVPVAPGDHFVATATDAAGNTSEFSPAQRVNAPPTLTAALHGRVTQIQEGQSVTLTGSVSDPDSADTETLLVDWGDGTTSLLTLPGGVSAFKLSHPYTDELAAGTVHVTVTDAAGDTGAASLPLTVDNV